MTITSDIPAEDIAVHSQLLHRLRNLMKKREVNVITREHGSSHPKEGTDFPICEECGEGVVGDVEERM